MPLSAGVVEDAGVPLRPWISTRQSRHEPNASSESVAKSFGTWMPASEAARMIEVPAGTVTGIPSISSVTVWPVSRAGVPRSIVAVSMFEWTVMALTFQTTIISLGGRRMRRLAVEIFREVLDGAHHRHGSEPAQGTERAVAQGFAEVADEVDVLDHALATHDLVDGLGSACGADPAGRALSARLDGAELKGEARLLGQVDGVVEHHDAAMSDHAALRCECLIVERHVEEVRRPIGAQRPADLHGANGTARIGAAAIVFDQFAQSDAEGESDEHAALDVAGELDRHRAARAAHAEIPVVLRPLAKNHRHARKRDEIVDDGWLCEQPRDRGQRRLGTDLAALALEAFQE